MKTLPIKLLKANTLPSTTIFLDEEYILLTSDTPITEDLLQNLATWNYQEILSQDEFTPITEEGALKEFEIGTLQDNVQEKQFQQEVQQFYVSMLEFTHKLFGTFSKEETITIEPLSEQIKLLHSMLKTHRRFILRLNDLDRSGFSYTITHCVNVAILSLAIGESLKFPSHKMIELGMAGLLHELGMFKLPDIQNVTRPLTAAEKRALTAHPLLGYQLLKGLKFPPNVTLAVLEHHEKENGQGYPQGLSGDKITISAKIIAIASSYDARISPRPHREARNGHACLLEMLQEMKISYDEQLLKRLIFVIGLFPIGSFVELTEGSIAKIDDVNPQDSKRPFLKILTDDKKNPLNDFPVINLADKPHWNISRALDPNEVQKLRADKILI